MINLNKMTLEERVAFYRQQLNLPTDKYSDEEVIQIIEQTQMLARIYINHFLNNYSSSSD